MAVTITESTITGESGVNETVVVAENDGQTDPISIEIDYSGYFARIATAMETIATNSTTIAQKITTIDANIDALKEAGDPRSTGDGIRTVQPYNEVYLAYLWKEILQGKVIDNYKDDKTDADVQALIDKINNHDNDQLVQREIEIMKARISSLQSNFSSGF